MPTLSLVALGRGLEATGGGRRKQLGEDVIWGAGVYLADSQAEAIRRVEPAHDERYKWFAPFGFVRYADEEGRSWGTPGAPTRVPTLADGVAQKACFCGPAKAGNRRDQVDRSQIPRPRALHDPLGGGHPARGVQGSAALVCRGRNAGLLLSVDITIRRIWFSATIATATTRSVLPGGGTPGARVINRTDDHIVAGGERGGEKHDQAEKSHITTLSRAFVQDHSVADLRFATLHARTIAKELSYLNV